MNFPADFQIYDRPRPRIKRRRVRCNDERIRAITIFGYLFERLLVQFAAHIRIRGVLRIFAAVSDNAARLKLRRFVLGYRLCFVFRFQKIHLSVNFVFGLYDLHPSVLIRHIAHRGVQIVVTEHGDRPLSATQFLFIRRKAVFKGERFGVVIARFVISAVFDKDHRVGLLRFAFCIERVQSFRHAPV